ncbi:hypothetical protein CCACVL1_00056, partial [Corchorus capsularis]
NTLLLHSNSAAYAFALQITQAMIIHS